MVLDAESLDTVIAAANEKDSNTGDKAAMRTDGTLGSADEKDRSADEGEAAAASSGWPPAKDKEDDEEDKIFTIRMSAAHRKRLGGALNPRGDDGDIYVAAGRKIFPANALRLCLSSTYFEDSLEDIAANPKYSLINIGDDVDPGIFLRLMEFLHKCAVRVTKRELRRVCRMAAEFEIDCLGDYEITSILANPTTFDEDAGSGGGSDSAFEFKAPPTPPQRRQQSRQRKRPAPKSRQISQVLPKSRSGRAGKENLLPACCSSSRLCRAAHVLDECSRLDESDLVPTLKKEHQRQLEFLGSILSKVRARPMFPARMQMQLCVKRHSRNMAMAAGTREFAGTAPGSSGDLAAKMISMEELLNELLELRASGDRQMTARYLQTTNRAKEMAKRRDKRDGVRGSPF